MKKPSPLAEGLRAAAGNASRASVATVESPSSTRKKAAGKSVLIGGHYTPEVRRTLLLVQAAPENEGKNLKQLLGEAINDLCVKYGKPEPYQGDA